MRHVMGICYIVICAPPGSQYFSTLSRKRYDFRKTLLNIKCVFLFSLQRLLETFLIIRRIERDMIKNTYRLSCKVFSPDFNKLGFYRQTFEKYLNIKCHENPSSGSRVVSCGRTDGQTDITKLRVAFRNFATAPNNKEEKYSY